MDPITISLLGMGLYKAFEKVAEKTVIDPALEKGLEPFKQWLTRGYDEKKDALALQAILAAALDDLLAQYPKYDPQRLIAALKLTGLTPEQHTALAAAAVEMSHLEPSLVPVDLLKSLELEEERREMLARFLFHLRWRLAQSEKYKDAIDYASDLDRRGLLTGLSQQLLDLQKQASAQTSLLDTLGTLHHLTGDDKQALQSYLDWARQRWGSLTLPLIRKRTGDTMHADLKQVFVPLFMRDLAAEEHERLKNRSGKMQEEKIKEIPPIGLGELVRRYPRFILIGSPGCGKTTLLHRLALAFAEGRAADDLGWDKKPLLPIFTRLRNFGAFLAQNKDKYPAPVSGSLVAYLENQVRDGERIHLTPDFFDRRLNEGGCLVLLDGLDEVSENRSEVAQHIYAFIECYGAAPGNCFGISSRPRGYETVEMELRPANLAAADVRPLDEAGIRSLIQNLFSLIQPDRQQQLKDTHELAKNIFSRRDLIEIASTPLFCSALVQVYKFHGANLPQRRVDVLDEIVDLLLGFWRAQQSMANAVGLATEGTGKPRRLEEAVSVKRARLSFLAYQMQERHIVEIQTAAAVDLLAGYLEERERVKDKDTCCAWAEEFLINSHEHSGLLAEHEPGSYSFLHKAFMEYLAATWLVNRNEVIPAALAHLDDDWWEQVILLAGAHPKLSENFRSELINQILDQAGHSNTEKGIGAHLVLAGRLAADMAESLPGPEHERVEETLLSGLGGPELSAKNRARVGVTLAYLGDPRPEVMTVDGLRFCFVPDGEFWMGEGKKPKKINLPAYWMGEYPVSNTQFETFVKQDGYLDAAWWQEAQQAGFWSENGFKGRYDDGYRTGPVYFNDLLALPNHPVVGVSWYEALAFTRWLTRRWLEAGWLPQNWSVTLPSEQQWEKAARGGVEIPAEGGGNLPAAVPGITDLLLKPGRLVPNPLPKRAYPWGDTFDSNRANTSETSLGNTSALGCFPLAASPYGLQELSGNVCEWQADWYGKDQDRKTLRGGSWSDYLYYAGCSDLDCYSPDSWFNFIGFRIALPLPCALPGQNPAG